MRRPGAAPVRGGSAAAAVLGEVGAPRRLVARPGEVGAVLTGGMSGIDIVDSVLVDPVEVG